MTRGPRIAYVNARLIDPASGLDTVGALLTVGAVIADLGPGLFADGLPEGAVEVDCIGHCLAPGLIDMRVNLPRLDENFSDGHAAAAGGVTTMICLPEMTPTIDTAATVEFVRRRASQMGVVNLLPYGALTKELAGERLAEFGLLAEAGAVAFTDGTRALADAVLMRRALAYADRFDRMVVQHPEEPTLAADGAMNEGELATRLGLVGIPAAAEVMMLERDLRLVELTGARYHAAHLSTAAAVDAIRGAKSRGLPVSCDTAPPYFVLNENEVGDYRTFAKLSPPLRSETDRRAIVQGLADGVIDVIASDHTPRHTDSKRLPFAQAAAGIVGLETLLPLALGLYHKGHMSLVDLLAAMTSRPAALLGLDAGRLAPKAPADLVLFDPNAAWVIDTEAFRSRAKNAPFDDHPVQGRVLRTVVAGKAVFRADA
ncbi:MAG: dihydroorotase [Alphaproteobacteria bacterium]